MFKKIIIILYFILLITSFDAEAKKIRLPSVSENNIFTYTNPKAKINVIAFIGGGGIKKGIGKSQNPLARERKAFKRSGMNYYVFPNPKIGKGISLSYRKNKDHIKRISRLIKHIKKKNNLPIILVGHSRGSVSVSAAANVLGQDEIKGIVVMGSLTATSQKIKPPFLISNMLKKTTVPVLIIHHKEDRCIVTPFSPAKSISEKKGYPIIVISGGGSTGNTCGPLHYHGFEGTMSQVITEIKKWAEGL